MNVYDPLEGIVYRHVARRADPQGAPVTDAPGTNRLPNGYANRSLRTYLGRTGLASPAA